jgi:LEA14-like dessication related protein
MNTLSSRRKRVTCIITALVLFLVGCATLTGMEPPSITLAGLRVVEVKGLETAFELDLRVLNPNKTPLSIHGIDCDLSFNDRHLAKGVANPQKEITAYGSDIVTVQVYASVVDLFGAARRLIQGAQSETPEKKWRYAVQGHLEMGGVWSGRVPFDAKGEIDPQEMVSGIPAQ